MLAVQYNIVPGTIILGKSSSHGMYSMISADDGCRVDAEKGAVVDRWIS
jgi:hypothetical protein